MENTNRDTAQDVAPQRDWRNDETNAWLTETPDNQNEELLNAEPYGTDGYDERLNAAASNDDPDPDDEDEEETEEEEDENADWGHIDPAEGNSPFPDSNDPSGPGSAV